MRTFLKRILVFTLCFLSLQSSFLSFASAANTKAYFKPSYSGTFSWETLYRHNQTIHGWFKFKINVDGSNVTIAPDGPFSERGYVWGDDYTLRIYNRKGNLKFEERVTWWGNVYTDVLNIVKRLGTVKINLGDTIEVSKKHYQSTVSWGIDPSIIYNNGTDRSYVYPDSNTQRYLLSERGFVKQTQDFNVEYDESSDLNFNMELRVRNTATGSVENRSINFFIDSQEILQSNTHSFGPTTGYVWDDDVDIIAFEADSGRIKAGIKIIKGVDVTHVLDVLANLHLYDVAIEDYLYIYSKDRSVKLKDNAKQFGKNLMTIFTNTGTNFSNGVSNTTFFLAPTGMFEVKP